MSDDAEAGGGASRRSFLALGGAAAGAAAYSQVLGPLAEPTAALVSPDAVNPFLADYTLNVRRPSDQCVLILAFWNMKPDFTKSPPVFKRIDSSKPNYLIVTFGAFEAWTPQHMTEHAFPLKGGHLAASAQAHAPTPKPTTSAVSSPPVGARLAGSSRLAFVVPNSAIAPAATHPLTLDTTTLLNWVGLTLSVAPNAVAPFGPLGALQRGPAGLTRPKLPGIHQTSIEMPYGLIISPPAYLDAGLFHGPFTGTSVFVNATDPVTHNGWTELWHTRLAAKHLVTVGRLGALEVDEKARELRTIRALWCTDPRFADDVKKNHVEPTDSRPPFRSSLDYADRYDIVRLSSDFTGAHLGGPYHRVGTSQSGVALPNSFVPSPATVDRLMLTALGGWLDCEAHWDLPHHVRKKKGKKYVEPVQYNSSLLAWRHRAVQGRDCYVRVVRKGYLFPWGHRASLITVTEREPTITGKSVGAYLRQKTFIVVGQPIKSYGGAGDFAPFDGRKIPFRSVEALTLVTPDLAAPVHYLKKTQQKHSNELVFEPKLSAHAPFLFHFRGTDWAGDPIDFRTQVLWVDDTVAYGDHGADTTLMNRVITKWRDAYPTVNLHNQRVSVAQPKDPDTTRGDTQIVASSFQLGVDHPSGSTAERLVAASQPAFYPAMHTVLVSMPEAKTVSGNAVGGPTLEYEPSHYLDYGFAVAHNKGGVILRRVAGTTRHPITFRGDKSGGAVTPNLGIDGFSREIGPSSGNITELAAGVFNPQNVFAGVNAKLLGGIELQAILSTVGFGDGDNSQALQLTSVELPTPHRVVTTLDWHPSIEDGGPELPPGSGNTITIFKVNGDPDQSMDLHAVIVTSLDSTVPSTTTVVGQIRDFELDLFGDGSTYFIRIPFDSLTFHAQTGKKTDVDVQISSDGVQFKGALEFVQDLATYLNFGGSGLVIDTAGDAITAVLTLAIPSLGLGVFALENLAFSAGVAIPYNGDPVRFTFAFCSRENPFQLEIMIFTGGGFIGLAIGADGVELLEFSFDFGLGLSIDIGVASGQVSLVGGVYFESEKQTDGTQDVDLTAYVKASGGVSCLGIISISVELYLALNYEDSNGSSSVSGDAEMSISVHILFFGGTVGFSVHEEFAGASDSEESGNAVSAHARKKALAGAPASTVPPYPVNTFGYSIQQSDWDEYCTSFALIGVGE
jgi:hypothetical protein